MTFEEYVASLYKLGLKIELRQDIEVAIDHVDTVDEILINSRIYEEKFEDRITFTSKTLDKILYYIDKEIEADIVKAAEFLSCGEIRKGDDDV